MHMILNLNIIGLPEVPNVNLGDDIATIILQAVIRANEVILDGDIVVIAQKIVSKSEGRMVHLSDVKPSQPALALSEDHHRDPRLTELILRESKRIVRMDRGNIISETTHGFVCANAGIDSSNVEEAETVCLLPIDPDKSAYSIRTSIKNQLDVDVAVIISDTFGRPWREGAVNVAIGCSGINALCDYRGTKDTYGRELKTTTIAIADELASAAELLTGKVNRMPAVLIRGYKYQTPLEELDHGVKGLIRSSDKDMFR